MSIRWSAAWLPLLLVGAAALRFAQLELVSVTADEGIHGLAADLVSRGNFETVAGPPSVGIRNTPFFIYTLSLPMFVVREPLAGVAFIAALQLLALALAWHWGAKWFGRPAAGIACVLLATSPWMTLYARNMWPPSAVMPFGMALVGLGCDWLRQGGAWRLCGLTALALLLPAMHFSGFVAPVWVLGVLIAGRSRLPGWRTPFAALAGLAIGLLPWLPWLYFEHVVMRWADLAALRNNAAGKATFAPWKLVEYGHALLHAGGLRYWFDGVWEALRAREPAGAEPLRQLGAVLTAIAFAAAAWQARRADGLRRALWAWLLLPIAMLLLLRPDLHPHYLLVAFPVPFLLIGDALARLATTASRRAGVAAALAMVVAGNLLTLEGVRRVLDADLLKWGNRYQLTLRQRRAAAISALDDVSDRSVEVAGHFNGYQPGYDWLHRAELVRRRRSHQPPDPDTMHWFDEDPTPEFSATAQALLRERRPPFGPATVERMWWVGPTRIVRLRGSPALPMP